MASSADQSLDEEGAPVNAATLRQKMQQQRERTLQKQRSVCMTSNMVKANESVPTTNPPTPSTTRNYGNFSGATDSPVGSSALASLETYMSRHSMEDSSSALVMPEVCQDTKEEEARRRNSLEHELDRRGISSVFDPTPNSTRDACFDFANIGVNDMKPFLVNPTPKHAGMVECRIIRQRGGLNKLFPKYTLESDSGVFLMIAKKQKHNKTSNYAISMSKSEMSKEADTFLGKLRSNFLGLEFVAYSSGMNPKKIDPWMAQYHALQLARQELVAIQYSSSLWGAKPRGPRKITVAVPRVEHTGERLVCRTLHPEQDGLIAMQKSASPHNAIDTFQNKAPKWNEQIGAFVLNFNKRVTQASVKNFQLTSTDDPDTVFLQFGRVGKDVFNVDFRYPFSPFQAFAICLSSFDYKLCCE